MKTTAIQIIVLFLGTFTAFATTPREEAFKGRLRDKIESFLEKPTLTTEETEVFATVEFMLNAKGKIVVLNISSDSDVADSFIKERLDDRRLISAKNKVTRDRTYVVPVKIYLKS